MDGSMLAIRATFPTFGGFVLAETASIPAVFKSVSRCYKVFINLLTVQCSFPNTEIFCGF